MQTTYSLLFSGLLSFVAALALTPLCRNLFQRIGVLDWPDRERKLHRVAVPRVGGIPVALAYILPFLFMCVPSFGGRLGHLFRLNIPWTLPAAAAIIFAVGLIDDIRSLKPMQKLLGQLVAAGVACWGGVRIDAVFVYPVSAWVGVPLTLLWLVGCANAFNLIDGVDGLAAGVGVVATITIVLSALLQGNLAVAAATVPLAAALGGFLRYNFHPASIFLGDSGSLLTGFLLGAYGVLWSEKSTTVLGTAVPLLALAFPLLDTSIAICCRMLRGQPILIGDRRHIHHRLLDRGLSPRQAVLLLYGFCGLGAAMSLAQWVHERYAGLLVIGFCVVIWMGIQWLGYVEFGALIRLFRDGMLRSTLISNIHLSEFREELATASTPEECWHVVRQYYPRFGFSQITLRLAGRSYSEIHEPADPADSWLVLVPISLFEYAQLSRAGKRDLHPNAAAAFADALGASLRKKMSGLPSRVRETAPPARVPAAAAEPVRSSLVRTAGSGD